LQIAKIRVGKNINAVAQIAATAALQDLDYMRRYVDEVKEAKLWILNELNQKNIKTKDTSANFILINVASPTKILNFLESHNIYIRDRSNMPQLQGYIRLTIGDQLSMKRFWKIFEQIPSDWIREEDDNQQKVGS